MRTTLNIDNEALSYAKQRANATGRSLGAVVSEALLEVGRPKTAEISHSASGFPIIRSTNEGEAITSEQVQAALDEEDTEKYRGTL